MSVLSEWDIINELGKGILIYPFKGKSSFRGCHVCLTASKYAYSVKNKKLLQLKTSSDSMSSKEEFFFEIDGQDTVIIWTNESIVFNNNFCGSVHSRLSLASKGIGHIGTRVNPNWGGILAIVLHNHNLSNENPIKVKVNDIVAYLAIYKLYLRTSSTSYTLDNPGRIDIIPAGDAKNKLQEWIDKQDDQDNHQWMKGDREVLLQLLENSQEFKKSKEKLRKKSLLYFLTIPKEWDVMKWSTAVIGLTAVLSLLVSCFSLYLQLVRNPLSSPSSSSSNNSVQ
ncbi:MAG: hypothetical protein QNJ42_08435 [Crocosphaera sp.]|nr:hypothetical protein [Crocosphaera sp.]